DHAVWIGDRIECSEQGTSQPSGLLANADGHFPSRLPLPPKSTFRNVDLALKTAGGKGWSHVYRVVIYSVDCMNDEGFEAMIRDLKEWMLDHRSPFNLFGIKELALEGMRVEIEVVA
ncbi:endoribonuclease L-PSP, partial [Coprinopsis sp. MPI-PUGE-AT-0042]